MKPGISVCFVIKNGLINGYPFWESLNSCLPFANEIVISEGNSRDRTFDVLKVFKERNKDKVKLFRTDWNKFKSPHGEVIAKVSMEAMRKCTHEWIYYLQADEIVHQDNYVFLKEVITGRLGKYNSVQFEFAHFIGSWKPLPKGGAAYSFSIRMVRNIPAIRLLGDAWNFTGKTNPMCLAQAVPKPIYHLGWVFPKNIDQKNIEQEKIYAGLKAYRDKAQQSRDNMSNGYAEKKGLPRPDDYDDYPNGVQKLVGLFEYKLPNGVL